jgi:hypothetical protein
MATKLNKFHDAVQSLKLYRRAELPGQVDNAEIVKKLYVDPLPNDHIFQTVLRPNTTFIVGRKGTGTAFSIDDSYFLKFCGMIKIPFCIIKGNDIKGFFQNF